MVDWPVDSCRRTDKLSEAGLGNTWTSIDDFVFVRIPVDSDRSFNTTEVNGFNIISVGITAPSRLRYAFAVGKITGVLDELTTNFVLVCGGA